MALGVGVGIGVEVEADDVEAVLPIKSDGVFVAGLGLQDHHPGAEGGGRPGDGRHEPVELGVPWEAVLKGHNVPGTADEAAACRHIGDVGKLVF